MVFPSLLNFQQNLLREYYNTLRAFVVVNSIDVLFQAILCAKNFAAVLADAVACLFLIIPSNRFATENTVTHVAGFHDNDEWRTLAGVNCGRFFSTLWQP